MDELRARFEALAPNEQMRVIHSPLRICPLGAHVDHQHGLVTGMALDVSIDLGYTSVENGYVHIQSMDFPDQEIFHVDHVPEMIPGFWGNYLRGAVLALSRSHRLRRGVKGVISGKLPIGGLSSSAAVTTAYLMALCDVNELDLSPEQLIQQSHWVERHYIGLNNGILDQSANLLSRDDHLMMMDCRSGDYELIRQSAAMPEFEVVVAYSGLSQSLIRTDYNNRVDECKVAAWLLQELSEGKVSALADVRLRDIDETVFEQYKDELPGRFRRRAEHFYAENERVRRGVDLWRQGDLSTFGELMFDSGRSSIHLYECGCPELITLYHLLAESPGVYGARFSGAGYRGCCIGLVDPRYREKIVERIAEEYPVRHPEHRDTYHVYFCKIGDGARKVEGW